MANEFKTKCKVKLVPSGVKAFRSRFQCEGKEGYVVGEGLLRPNEYLVDIKGIYYELPHDDVVLLEQHISIHKKQIADSFLYASW